MAEPLMLDLHLEDDRDSVMPKLSDRILQIEKERGPLRHLTEQALRDEIEHPDHGAQTDPAVVAADSVEQQTTENQQQKVWKGREEMVKQLEYDGPVLPFATVVNDDFPVGPGMTPCTGWTLFHSSYRSTLLMLNLPCLNFWRNLCPLGCWTAAWSKPPRWT